MSTPESYLTEARRLQMWIGVAKGEMQANIYSARDAGATWQQIGDALAITKQAAQQRYGPPNTREQRIKDFEAANTAAGTTPSMFSDS